jgi:glycosyltransferase involved in cell wall biosynthesis
LVFIGSKDITDVHFEDYYNSLSIEITNKVIFLEKINFKELISLTRAATISVYPSFAEGFGIPPLESIAANVPTICSNTTAMAEFTFMKDFLFDPNSIEEIGQKITFAISQHSAKKIRETVKEKYSWKISASVLNNILRNG